MLSPAKTTLFVALSLLALTGCGGSGTSIEEVGARVLRFSSVSSSFKGDSSNLDAGSGTVTIGASTATVSVSVNSRDFRLTIPTSNIIAGTRINIGSTASNAQAIYHQDATGLIATRDWISADGSVEVIALNDQRVLISLENVTFAAQEGSENSAAGTFILNGTVEGFRALQQP